MIRVLLVDDHDIVRLGLRTYLGTIADIEIVGEARNGVEAVKLGCELQPDVILMDLLMPVMPGVEAIRQLRSAGCISHIVVLTSSIDDAMVIEAVRAGASSYVLKTSTASQLATAIQRAAHGEPTLDAQVQKTLLGQMQTSVKPEPWQELTEREQEVLRALATGQSNQEIATTLGIAVKTVKTHVGNIFVKLDVQDRTQAAIYAIRKGLA